MTIEHYMPYECVLQAVPQNKNDNLNKETVQTEEHCLQNTTSKKLLFLESQSWP